MANEWKKLAEKTKLPISKFVIEHVENSLAQEEKQGYPDRAKMIKQLKEKDEEITKLREDNRLLKTLSQKLDVDLRRYRAEPILDEDFQGVRAYDKELIGLLKKKGMIDSDHILQELGIDPKETILVKAVNKQLENLQKYGLVQPTSRGWRWTG
jgi:hypothetical protein